MKPGDLISVKTAYGDPIVALVLSEKVYLHDNFKAVKAFVNGSFKPEFLVEWKDHRYYEVISESG